MFIRRIGTTDFNCGLNKHGEEDAMQIKIEIDLDNAAFDDGNNGATELNRLLGTIPFRVAFGWQGGKLIDFNGNTVGHWQITKGGD